jgi:hypothetical protein
VPGAGAECLVLALSAGCLVPGAGCFVLLGAHALSATCGTKWRVLAISDGISVEDLEDPLTTSDI